MRRVERLRYQSQVNVTGFNMMENAKNFPNLQSCRKSNVETLRKTRRCWVPGREKLIGFEFRADFVIQRGPGTIKCLVCDSAPHTHTSASTNYDGGATTFQGSFGGVEHNFRPITDKRQGEATCRLHRTREDLQCRRKQKEPQATKAMAIQPNSLALNGNLMGLACACLWGHDEVSSHGPQHFVVY